MAGSEDNTKTLKNSYEEVLNLKLAIVVVKRKVPGLYLKKKTTTLTKKNKIKSLKKIL